MVLEAAGSQLDAIDVSLELDAPNPGVCLPAAGAVLLFPQVNECFSGGKPWGH